MRILQRWMIALALVCAAVVGTGAQIVRAPRPTPVVLFYENTNLGNAADTNFVAATPYIVPAGLMANNGDELQLDLWFTFSAAASVKSYVVNIGSTAYSAAAGATGGFNAFSNATAAASATVLAKASVRRLSPTAAGFVGTAQWTGAATVQGINYTTAAITWANPQTILAFVKDGTGNADAIHIHQFKITYIPVLQ